MAVLPNLMEAIELDGFPGFGGRGRTGAESGQELAAESASPESGPTPGHQTGTARVLTFGAVRSQVIAGTPDNGSVDGREAESSGHMPPDNHRGVNRSCWLQHRELSYRILNAKDTYHHFVRICCLTPFPIFPLSMI